MPPTQDISWRIFDATLQPQRESTLNDTPFVLECSLPGFTNRGIVSSADDLNAGEVGLVLGDLQRPTGSTTYTFNTVTVVARPLDIPKTETLILVGGPSKSYAWDAELLLTQLANIVHHNSTPMVLTTSRRTPPDFIHDLQAACPSIHAVPVEETSADWVPVHLSRAREVWVTQDSVSMVYEALSSGAPVGILEMQEAPQRGKKGGKKKLPRVARGLQMLVRDGMVHTFTEWAKSSHSLPTPEGELLEGRHEPIVPREEWHAVQRRMDAVAEEVAKRVKPRKWGHGPRRRDFIMPLEGILRCGSCGCPLTPAVSGKGHRYYQCMHRRGRSKPERCECPNLNADEIERFAMRQLANLRADSHLITSILSRLPDETSETVVAAVKNIDKLTDYCDPELMKELFSHVFEEIVFDWRGEKIDIKFKKE